MSQEPTQVSASEGNEDGMTKEGGEGVDGAKVFKSATQKIWKRLWTGRKIGIRITAVERIGRRARTATIILPPPP